MSDKHAKQSRSDVYHYDPRDLTIVGLDTPHKKGEHQLWDERANEPLDEAMIANIKTFGVMQPINAIKNLSTKQVEVIDGRQRVRHARAANEQLEKEGSQFLIKVPVVLKQGIDSKKALGIMISANEIRKSDEVITKAAKAARLQDIGATREEIAVAFGVTPQTISNWLALNTVAPEVKQAVVSGQLSPKAGQLFAGLTEDDQRSKLAVVLAQPLPENAGAQVETPKRVTVEDVKKQTKGTDPDAQPSMKELKRLVLLHDASEITISDDWLLLLRIVTGEFKPSRSAQFAELLKKVRES